MRSRPCATRRYPAETLAIVASKIRDRGDDGERPGGPRLARGRAGEGRAAADVVAVSTNAEAVERFGTSAPRECVRVLGLGRWAVLDGLGRRPLDHARRRPSSSASLLPASTPIDDGLPPWAPLEENLPVLMGLLGVWDRACFGVPGPGRAPPDDVGPPPLSLGDLQLLLMEFERQSVHPSTGRRRHRDRGDRAGGAGTKGQHSFHQLLHRGHDGRSAPPIGFRTAAQPARRPPRRPLIAPHAGAGEALALRRAPRRSSGRRAARSAVPHKGMPDLSDPRRRSWSGRPFALGSPRRSTSTWCSRRASSGHPHLRPVGVELEGPREQDHRRAHQR